MLINCYDYQIRLSLNYFHLIISSGQRFVKKMLLNRNYCNFLLKFFLIIPKKHCTVEKINPSLDYKKIYVKK